MSDTKQTEKTKAEKLFPVTLKKGYWPKDDSGKRQAGETVELPVDEAKDIIAKGIAVRADAIPE